MVEQKHCDHDCVCFLIPEIEERIPEEVCSAITCGHDTRKSHTTGPIIPCSPEDSKYYLQGYADGKASVIADLNVLEDKAKKEERERVLKLAYAIVIKAILKDGNVDVGQVHDELESLRSKP